jgi:preprotein translocase subunit SecF
MRNFNLNVEKNYKIYLFVPAVVIVIGLITFAIRGLNLGIDFLGGSIIQIELGQTFETSDIRAIMDQFDENADITYAGENNTQVIITSRINFDDATKNELLSKFEEKYNLGDDALLSVDTTSASIGKDLQKQALLASLVAIICLLIYITIRFEFLFGIATIICLLHDLMIVLSVYAVFHIYVTSNFIAAMLTILGYSINATIVVFDRVREERKKMGKKEYANVIDVSVKKSLKRTLYTMITTLLTMISLYIFGVESIRNFLLPMMIGFICGTYSSLFIAGSVWYMFKKNIGLKKAVKAR